MPYFFILPLWFLFCIGGLVLLFVPRLRFLATHIILGSTGAVVASFLLSLGLFLGSLRVLDHNKAWIAMVLYLAGMAMGAFLGGILGIWFAIWLNRKIGFARS